MFTIQKSITKSSFKVFVLFLMAACSAYAFIADFAIENIEAMGYTKYSFYNFLDCFNGIIEGKETFFSILTISVFILYYKLYEYCSADKNKFIVLSAVLSILTMLQYPYEISDSIVFLWGNKFQIIQSIIFSIGYFCFFNIFIRSLFVYMNKARLHKDVCVNTASYWKIVLKFMIIWSPNVIVKFPGAFCPDSSSQLRQWLGLKQFTSHHPPFHTFLLGMCASIGNKVFHSYNIGVFIFIFMQYVIMALIFGYAMYYLEHRGVPQNIKFIIWLIYCTCPFIIANIGLVIKDVIYSSFCFAFVIFCIKYIDNKEQLSVNNTLGLIISAVFTVLTRNNGKEVIYPVLFMITMVTIIKYKKNMMQFTRACMVLVLPIVLSLVVSYILEVNYEIQKGSIREALSFPFQQTARTVAEHSDEIPLEEKEVIDSVLPYDLLAECYTPNISDPVKGRYKGWDNANMLAYARVWLKQFVRYPMTYCEAALSQNYPVFCILRNRQGYYCSSEVWHEEWQIISEYPLLDKIDNTFVQMYMSLNRLPIIGILSNTNFWCVMLVVLSSFILKYKKYVLFIALSPLWLTIVCVILGPVASVRYAYPISYSMPFLMGYYVTSISNN